MGINIFPKNHHFKVTMNFNFIVGIWPFVFKDNPVLRTLYNVYAKFVLATFAIFVICAYVEILILREKNRTEEISGNLCITLLCSMIIFKAIVIKRPGVSRLIKGVFHVEEKIYEEEDRDVIEQYHLSVALTHRTSLVYIVTCVIVITCHFTSPLLSARQVFDEAINRTITIGYFPVSMWMPWDSRLHYWRSYICLILAGGLSASPISVFVDIFMFSLIIFPSGQMDILMYKVRNFKKYAKKVENLLGCSSEEASFVTIRQLILKHKDVIRYVDNYNDEMRYITLFDSLVCSIQLAALTVQLVRSDCGLLDLIHWGGFVGCMILRLLLYYWHANEIMVKSSSLGNAIWECEWFEEPYGIKQLMLLMIARSQKPLRLDIGKFTFMTLEHFLVIVKAAYSYVMIMYR